VIRARPPARPANPRTPSGCARCTCAPAAVSVSAAQYHPYVASSTTLGVLARPGDLLAQLCRAVGDPRGLQLPAIRRHPHQHAAAPVQVHPGDLPAVVGFGHKGFPVWWRRMHAPSSIRQKRRPAPNGIRPHPTPPWPGPFQPDTPTSGRIWGTERGPARAPSMERF
jgi:hypothetical protein